MRRQRARFVCLHTLDARTSGNGGNASGLLICLTIPTRLTENRDGPVGVTSLAWTKAARATGGASSRTAGLTNPANQLILSPIYPITRTGARSMWHDRACADCGAQPVTYGRLDASGQSYTDVLCTQCGSRALALAQQEQGRAPAAALDVGARGVKTGVPT